MTMAGDRVIRTMRRLTLGAAASVAVAALVVPAALATPETDAGDAINQAWEAAGGPDSVLGNKDGGVFEVGEGYGQKFADGKMFFTPGTGAHLVYGAVLDKYESLGGPADSDLGFPNIDVVAGLVGPKSRVSTFSASDKPAIFWTPDTGAWSVRGALNAAWDALGGSAGQLGVPVEDERYDGDVVSQKFTRGELSWNSKANTFTSNPSGLADSLAGLDVPRDPATMINLAWRAGGGLGGPLGARQGALAQIGDNAAAQGYASGKIFYSPETGAHAVTGAILSKYESVGGPTGDLGFPAGPETDGGVPNSRIGTFSAPDNPEIFWTPDTGAIVVRGPINAAWAKLGGATGKLGVPIDDQTSKGDTVRQTFTGGELSWNKATKEFSSKPADLAASLTGMQMPDAVAKTPAAPPSGGTADRRDGFRWWWLAILLPALGLLGLMAMAAQRKSRVADGAVVSDRAFDRDFGARAYGPDTDSDSGVWSPRAEEGAGYDADEDAIDTAPTRIPTEADFAEPAADVDEWDDVAEQSSGRHAASALATSAAAWRLELGDDFAASARRRHAIDDPRTEEFDAVVEERVEWFESEPEVSEAPVEDHWRPAIHLPLADPLQAPEGYAIKGSAHSGLYFTPDSALYDSTVPEIWFASEESAQATGFVRAPE